jgi:hypothetical protein
MPDTNLTTLLDLARKGGELPETERYESGGALNFLVGGSLTERADAMAAELLAAIVERDRTIDEAARFIFRIECAYSGIFDEDEAVPVIIADLKARTQEVDGG